MKGFILKQKFYALIIVSLYCQPSMAQPNFKSVYGVDNASMNTVDFMDAYEVIETNIPNREIAIIGRFAGTDNTGKSISPYFLMQIDYEGNPQLLNYFQDASPLPILGAFGFSLAFDNENSFYLAGASNTYQTITRADNAGSLIWSKMIGHHEFNSVIFDQNAIIALGQDESFGYGHVLLLVKLDSAGNLLNARKYQTPGFDMPVKVIHTPSGYLIAGSVNASSVLLIHVDSSFNIIWSNTYDHPSASHIVKGLEFEDSTNSFAITGYVRGTGPSAKDSLFLLKTDFIGNPIIYKVYQTNPATSVNGLAITKDANTNSLLIAGSYSKENTNNRQPFVMRVDSAGSILWANDYGEGDSISDEVFNDITYLEGSQKFATVGRYLLFDTTGSYSWHICMVNADIVTGSTGCDEALSFVSYDRNVIVTSDVVTEVYFGILDYDFISKEAFIDDLTECEICIDPTAAFSYIDSQFTVVFFDSSKSATSWLWDFGDENTNTLQNPQHTYSDTGSYFVCLTVTNYCGPDADCMMITIIDSNEVGLQSLKLENTINIFPNPFSTIATIEIKSQTLNSKSQISFVIYNIIGQEVKRSIFPTGTSNLIIRRDNLSNGMYFYKVESEHGVLGVGKIIITL